MKKALSTIIVIAVIAIAAVFAYQTIFLTPERVTKTALEKMLDVKSYHISGTALLAGKIKGFDINAKADIESDSDITNKNSPKILGVLNASINAQGIQLGLSSEFKTINDSTYARLVKIPELFKNTKIPIDVNKYKEIWIKIPLEKYKNAQFGDSQAAMNEVKNWTKEEKIFSKIEKLKPEKINENSCYHYMGILNKEALLNLFKRLDKVSGKKTDEKIYADNKDINIELWISKKDMMLNKIKLAEIEIKPMGTDDALKISFEGIYSKYNVPVNITPPEVSISIEEIIGEFMKNFKIGTSVPGISVPGISMPGISMPGISAPGISAPQMPLNMPAMPKNMPNMPNMTTPTPEPTE